ncbi:MAG: hypothetical protein R3B12_00720 [Candidatus Saccharimonadales bacterium]
MSLHRVAKTLSIVFIFSLPLVSTIIPRSVQAADYCSIGGRGRAGCVGYFNGKKANPADGVTNVVSGGLHVNSANAFINQVMDYYNSSGQDRNGGAFIINVMMGYDGPGEGMVIPQKVIDDWKDRVRWYEEKGWVDWNKSYTKPNGSRNSAYFIGIKDPAFHAQNGQETQSIIQFNGPGVGNLIRIQRSCGNFLGDLATLDKPSPTATINPSAGPDLTVNVGNNVTFTHWANVKDDKYTNDDKFSWSISGPGSISGNTKISGPNRRVDEPYTISFNTRGTYTRVISITDKPNYATVESGGTQKITVNGWDIRSDAKVDGLSSGYKYVLVGTTVTFSGEVCNSGPAPVHIGYIDGDWYVPGNAVDFKVLDLNDPDKKAVNGCAYASATKKFDVPGEYCAAVRVTPAADNNLNRLADKRACVQVVNVNPNPPAYKEYEKGSAGIDLGFSVGVNNGGAGCPAGVPITIVWNYKIGPPINVDQNKTFTYGNGTCSNSDSETVTFNDAQKAILNNASPGTTYPTSVTFNGVTQPGRFGVYEVPFARFYGNDIYATAGDIRFNSTDNPSGTTKRGSVDQYAALAFGTVTIDTSAFRTINPVPPDGLDASGSKAISGKNANQVYTDVTGNLPKTCGEIESGGLNATEDGCYIIKKATSLTPTNNSWPVPDWAKNNGGIPVLGWGDTFGSGVTTYTKKITAVNPTDKMLMIVGDVINLTSAANYTDPAKTGVLLIISEGPIVVDNNVKRIDAILVSKTGIYTCGYAGYGPAAKVGQNQIHSTCRVPLNINGAVSAPTIDFRRGGGSRYLNTSPGDEQQNCNVSKGIQNCADRGNMPNNTGKSAEIINYPAYLYFAKPYLKNQSTPGDTVDAMFVVPPKL